MDRTYFIRKLDKKKIKKEAVTGEEISIHFAARDEDELGWVITHLPTGQMLVRCGFATFPEARDFTLGVEKVLGKLLDNKSGTISPQTPEQKKMVRFLRRLSEEYADQVVTMKDVIALGRTMK